MIITPNSWIYRTQVDVVLTPEELRATGRWRTGTWMDMVNYTVENDNQW